ncbi:hypothetical protein PIROE2DRAFT_67808 [Piromyces sp. E2]|nr:hypothetical protein PIROE2DRAFT_67808 [Piromyces sp. E2]|eukprot:OUM57716.1 hypothetical protein PIROE2DRAFT_67808 [Piromyces sp. E2]
MNNSNNDGATNPPMAQNPLLALINGNASVPSTMNTTNNPSVNTNTNPILTGVSISVQDLFNSVGANAPNATVNTTGPSTQPNPMNVNLEMNKFMNYFKA